MKLSVLIEHLSNIEESLKIDPEVIIKRIEYLKDSIVYEEDYPIEDVSYEDYDVVIKIFI